MKTIDAPQSPESFEQPNLPQRKRQEDPVEEFLVTSVPPLIGVLVGSAIMVAIGILLVGPANALTMLSSALGSQHSAWYLSRASAFAAYLLLWWSMILGLAISNRLARIWPGGPTVGDLHEHASLLGLGFGMLHGLVLLGDAYIGYSLPQILIPFAGASYRPLWVGLGQIGIYLMGLVTLSSYVRKFIGAGTWRKLHYLSFAAFGLSLVHGIASGTDSSNPWVFWMYVLSGLSVLAMTIYRIQVAGAPKNPTAIPAQRV
jgi:predicted ferric reductase